LVLREKKRDQINGFNLYASLFDNYAPYAPWFEFVQVSRKGLLILVTAELSRLIKWRTTHEAVESITINGTFLAMILFLKPMRYFPSSLPGSPNLYQLVEVSSVAFTIFGNIIALLAIGSSDVDSLGTALFMVNVAFFVLFVFWFHYDYRNTKKRYRVKKPRKVERNVWNEVKKFRRCTAMLDGTTIEKVRAKSGERRGWE